MKKDYICESGSKDYAVRKSQCACVVEATAMTWAIGELFHEVTLSREDLGNVAEGNRLTVWTLSAVISETKGDGE